MGVSLNRKVHPADWLERQKHEKALREKYSGEDSNQRTLSFLRVRGDVETVLARLDEIVGRLSALETTVAGLQKAGATKHGLETR